MFKTRKSKLVVCALAGSLVVGAAGVGAVTNMNSVIAGNHFAAAVNGDAPNPDADASVTLTGSPVDYTFDTTVNGDSVSATWTVKDEGKKDATLTGGALTNVVAKVDGKVATDDTALADNLLVTYKVGDESFDGGTVSKPTDLVGNGLEATLASGASEDFTVTVTLAQPFNLIAGHKDGQSLELNADYNLGWSTSSDS